MRSQEGHITVFSSRIQDDLVTAGAWCTIVVSVILLGPVVREFRAWWVAARGCKAEGHVETVLPVKHDKYGDPVRWAVTTEFRADVGGRHPVIQFREELPVPRERKQKVSVRYNVKRPEKSATIRPSNMIFGRAAGFLGLAAVMFFFSGGLLFHWF